MQHVLRRAATLALVLAAPLPAQLIDAAGLPNELGLSYGFLGPEVSRFNDGLSRLVAGDLDGDGGADLAVVNNERSRIELLLRLRPGEAPDDRGAPDPDLVNEMPDEGFFRRESCAIEEKVGSLAVLDMDGDGRCELLFTGDSDRLTVAWHGARGGTARSVRMRLPGEAGAAAVRAGDVDGDGRPDAVVCGAKATWIFLQAEPGAFGEPLSLPHATSEPDGFELADVDGDRRLDLLFVKAESEWPLRWRTSLGEGRFAEERSARLAPLRAWAVADGDADGRPDVAVVRRQSGRVSLLRHHGGGQHDRALAQATASEPLSGVRIVPFEEIKDAEQRGFLLAPLDGGPSLDLLVAEPSAARVVLYPGASGAPQVFPSLVGASHPRRMQTSEGVRLVIAAPPEGAIGLSRVDGDGRVSFPGTLALPAVGEGAEAASPELLALDVAPPAAGEPDCLWVVLAAGKGRSRDYSLTRLDARGQVLASVPLADLKADPKELLVADLDRDGRSDALLSVPTEMPRILLGQADGAMRELNVAQSPGLGLLKGLSREALCWCDIDGDGRSELLVPGPNFARAFHLDPGGQPVVTGQFNLPDPSAQVACVAALDLLPAEGVEIVLAERSRRLLYVLGRTAEGSAGVLAQADLGDFVPRSLRPVPGATRLLLLSPERFGRLDAGPPDATFLPDLDFEVPVKDAYVNDIAMGDVNGDGVADLVMTETRRHELVIARARPEALDFALRFPVYDERLFESGRSGQEPREVVLAELTGDGLTDIAILVHDRLIVYPQEAPP